MSKTALDEKDNQSCGNCYLHSLILLLCLLTGNSVKDSDTCKKWLAMNTYKGCLIDFKKGGE